MGQGLSTIKVKKQVNAVDSLKLKAKDVEPQSKSRAQRKNQKLKYLGNLY
jgi:hypothetical protein